MIIRLVVWNMFYEFPYIGNNNPNWLSYSEGWLNHQPDYYSHKSHATWMVPIIRETHTDPMVSYH
jgi:hypothetical protein